MKMNLAVYTAQEGYSWQPGTALTAEDLGKFKKAIGRFPSADTADFPFGGVLKVAGRVVFYRYHVAKKIDFCGRDALYCVLGAIPLADAAKIDPATLFALPEFAGPMKPFPVALEVPEADSASVPDWLKNLDTMTLDVRITGPAANPSYAVEQNTIELQQTPAEDAAFDGRARSPSAPQCNAQDPQTSATDGRARSPSAPQCSVPDPTTSATDGRGARPARPLSRWMLWLAASLALLALIGAATSIALGLKARAKKAQESSSGPGVAAVGVVPDVAAPMPTNAATSSATANAVAVTTNAVAAAAAASLSESSAPSATNTVASVTNAAPILHKESDKKK